MYKIIGVDGREYGPATAEQLRQWVAEGRANAQTRVWAEGTTEWKLLAEFPEFAPLLARAPGPGAFPGAYRYFPIPRTNPLATTGMIMGILSLTLGCCCYGVPFNLLGIVFSLVALSQIKQDPHYQRGRGVAITGLVLSLLSLALALLLMVLGVALNSSDALRKIQQLGLARVGALAVPSLLTAAVLALTGLVLFCFDPSHHAFYPTCLFHRSTGLLCPGCGSLRALHQLLHGHVAAAFHYNALLVSSLPLAGWFALRFLLRKAKHDPVPVSVRPIYLWFALVVMVLFGVLRNLPWPAFAWLRP